VRLVKRNGQRPRGVGAGWEGGTQARAGGAALRGAVAGTIGSAIMLAVMELENRILPAHREVKPPPRRVVERAAEAAEVPVREPAGTVLTVGLHLGYGALLGAGYGLLRRRARRSAAVDGLLYGALVWAANFPHGGVMPRLGAAPPAGRQPTRENLFTLTTHSVYGLATAAAYEALR